jgi:hypothetical protein
MEFKLLLTQSCPHLFYNIRTGNTPIGQNLNLECRRSRKKKERLKTPVMLTNRTSDRINTIYYSKEGKEESLIFKMLYC